MLNSRDYQGRPLLTELQTRAQFSMWSVLAAPLIISGSILRMSNETRMTYTNTEVIAANQDPLGKAGERVAGGNVAPIDDGLPFNGPAAIGAPCVPGRAAQNWTFVTLGGFTNRLRNAGGNCTNVASGAPNGMLDVEGYCGNGTNLGFRLSADGLLQSDLQAKGQWTLCASIRPSDRWVQMGPCTGAGVTRWEHTAAGQLRAKGVGSTELCLDWAPHTLLPQQATSVWARPLSAAAGGSAHAITFLNVASAPRVVTCDSACFGAMGYPNTSTPLPVLHARDLWAHKDLPDIRDLTFSAGSLKPNGGHRMIKVWTHKSDDEKDAVNVRSFGAVGDGRSDDSHAFSRAIAAAAEASSAVFVPAGEFVVCNITVKAGVAVRGAGAASLIRTPPNPSDCVTRSSRGRKSGVLLELESHTSLANLRFLAVNSSALHAGDTSMGQGRRAVQTSVADILVQNCSFDGGGSAGPAAIHFERLAGPYTIQDNEIHGFASATSLDNAPNGLVARNVVRNCSRHGIVFSGATAECDYCWPNFTQYAIWNLTFANNSVYGQAGGSIWGSAGVGIAMVGNTIYGKGDVGLDFENCRDSLIRGNRVSGRFNAGVAVFLSSINVSVTNNVIAMAVPRDQKCNVDAPGCEGCSPCDGVWVTPFNPVPGAHHVPRITWTHKDIAVSHNTISVDRMLPQEEGGLSRGAGIGIDSGRNITLEKNVLLQNATLQVYEPSKLVISPVKSDDALLSMSRLRNRNAVLLAALVALQLGFGAGSPPTAWTPRGITGGGAFFSPGMHPEDAAILTATTDMGVVFRSDTAGDTWASLPFGDIGGGREAQVRFAEGSSAYAINLRGPSAAGQAGAVPCVSRDFGLTFQPLSNPLDGEPARTLDTDRSGKRLVLSGSNTIFVSSTGGGDWTLVVNASSPTGLRMAGEPLFTRSDWILFGTTECVTAVSPDVHATTAAWPNASEGIAGFAAAEVGDGSIQCFVLTAPPSGLAPDSLIETVMTSSLSLYSSTLHAPEAVPAWSLVRSLPRLVGNGGPLGATFVRMVPSDPDTAYVSGQCAGDCSWSSATGGYPFVVKLERAPENGGWVAEHVLRGNNNTHTVRHAAPCASVHLS